MPKLRNPSGRVTSAAQSDPRTLGHTEAQRRYRAGVRCPAGSGGTQPVYVERRNGLPPFKPYRYRGDDPLDGRML